MNLVLTAPPAIEPVTVEEAKAYLRIDHGHEDAVLASLITASRLHIETALNLALVSQRWLWQFDRWPKSYIVELPLRPVQSIESVRVKIDDDRETLLSSDYYILECTNQSAQLISQSGIWPQPSVPRGGIEIEFIAGFGEASELVPAPIRQALLMLVAHWYENREPVSVGQSASQIPDTVSALLMPYRKVRL